MPLPVEITNHFEQALDRKIEHFSGYKPVLDGLAFSYIDQLQDLESAIWLVIYGRLIDAAPGQTTKAEGYQLDVIGKIVGCKRQGYTDLQYYYALKLQVLINKSYGRFNDLLGIVRAAIGSGTITAYESQYNRVAYFRMDHISEPIAYVLYRALQKARAAGFRAILEYYTDQVSTGGLALAGWTDVDGNAASGVTGQGGFAWTDADGNALSGVVGGFFTAMQG